MANKNHLMPDSDGRWHPSELECYQMCPKLYEFRYVLKTPAPYKSWYLVRGTIIHEVFEKGFEHFTAIFDKHTANRSEISFVDKIDKDKPMMQEQCREYFKYLAREGIEIVTRECEVGFKAGEHTFSGIVDAFAIHPDTPEGLVEIHDYKTGVKWSHPAINRRLQFAFYYYAATISILGNGYIGPNRFFFGHTPDLNKWKSDGKKAVKGMCKGQFLYPIHIDTDDAGILMNNIDAILRGIEHKVFYTNPTSDKCRICEYEAICPKLKIGMEDGNVFEKTSQNNKELEAKLLASIKKETP